MNEDKPLETLGAPAACRVAELYERGETLFSHPDFEEITSHQTKSARSFVAYVVARELVVSADNDVSHASAMDRHQRLPQPQLKERLRVESRQ